MTKVYVKIEANLIINMDDGVELDDVISEMIYNFISQTEGASIDDTEITDYNVTDSK